MIHVLLVFYLVMQSLNAEQPNHTFLQDETIAVIYGPEETILITRSDLRSGLDGMPRTLRQVIVEALMLLDAQRLKITVSDEDIDRFFMQLQKQNGYTRFQIEQMFKQLGYTFEEGRELLRKQQMIEQIVDYRVKSDRRMLLRDEQVESYYHEYPLYTPTIFTLQQAFIPFSEYSVEEIEQMIKSQEFPEVIMWEDPFTLDENDLAEDKQFIRTAPLPSIVEQELLDDGIEITRLINRVDGTLISLEDRRNDIELNLRKNMYYTLLDEYGDKLLNENRIYFVNPEDKKLVYGVKTKHD